MSMMAHRLGMSRLAPVQAVSHGHPITSGFPRSIMDYYISWAGAELPLDQAQLHYTEELKLIPSDSLHQYYEERTKGGRSLMDNQSYSDLVNMGRSAFSSVPPDGNWYLIMQKPFKLMPEFDEFLAGILKKDPKGRVIMHEESSPNNRLIFIHRLTNAGCDMNRVHFMPVLPHYQLMALYILSDVILDSFPAGGCTTTREVLEAGKVLVSLPSTLLGSRWTLGYLNIIGDDVLLKNLIAENMDHYTSLATDLGKNITKRSEMEQRIRANIHKLYRSYRSVEEWTKILLEISPVKVNQRSDEF
jgi:protein O-GlcNAc transferase